MFPSAFLHDNWLYYDLKRERNASGQEKEGRRKHGGDWRISSLAAGLSKKSATVSRIKNEGNLIKRVWLIVIGAVIVVSVFVAFDYRAQDRTQCFSAKADRGDIRQVVESTGTINAVITVQVGSQDKTVIAALRSHSSVAEIKDDTESRRAHP